MVVGKNTKTYLLVLGMALVGIGGGKVNAADAYRGFFEQQQETRRRKKRGAEMDGRSRDIWYTKLLKKVSKYSKRIFLWQQITDNMLSISYR
ncbi:MAG: hypothetical protein LBU35_03185 [Holosporales bacterium]|jgi:hypothetical protein|nr:hypothetical protein [Holosporales bacterium]